MRAHPVRHILVVTAAALFTMGPGRARAQFPITQSFTGATAPGWTLKGSAVLTANGHGDAAGAGWLRLTDATTNQAGTAYYDTAFPSTLGIVATFDYADYGGTNADGFSVFLIDGATATPTVGSSGGPLGYAAKVDSTPSPPNSCTTGPQTVKTLNGAYLAGVTNGYVGVGFDEYGNFSNCEAGYGSDGNLHAQSVAIRGSGTSGTGSQTAFRYLTGKTVTPAFTIDGVARTASRRVRISIINQKITVEMDLGGSGTAYQTLIPAYDLATAPGQVAMPATFKLGISGSTGGSTNTHEIRNVRIEKPVRLTLDQTASPAGTVLVGDTLTYTITIANDATNDGTGTSIADHFPAGLSGVQWTCTATGGASLPAMSGAGDLVATATLPRSSSLTCVVTGTVASSALGTTLTNVVDVTPPAGSANLLSSAANTAVIVAYPTRTELTSSAPSTVYGQPLTLTAATSVTAGSATPAGTITFYDGATALGAAVSVDASGKATLTVNGLTPGDHVLTARFQGTPRFRSSDSDPRAQRVDQASTTVALGTSASSVVVGQAVTFTARVAPVTPGGLVPDGTVTFLDGGGAVATVPLDGAGQATLTTSALALGDHVVGASYGGSDRYRASAADPFTQSVVAASTSTALTVSPGSSVYGQAVTLSATVAALGLASGVPTGQVAFFDGAALLGRQDLDALGGAQLVLAPEAAVHLYSAVYLGVPAYDGSTSTAVAVVVSAAPTTTGLTSSANPAVTGQPVAWTVRVTTSAGAGTPTGTVVLEDGGAQLATATLDAGGEAAFPAGPLSVATHALTARYLGDADHAPSGASLSQRVNPASTQVAVVASPTPSAYGQAVTFTVTVTPRGPGVGTPTGEIAFTDNGTPLGTQGLSGGKASLTTGALRAGTHAIAASYGGDPGFAAGSGAVSHDVSAAATATALVADPAPSLHGEPVTLTAAVTTAPGAGTAAGTVTFRDGGAELGTAALDASGVARLSTAALPTGARSLTASYGGDADHAGSASPTIVQTVAPAATTVAVGSSLPTSTFGDEVTLTAAVAPVAPGAGEPTGTVTFLVDGTPIGTGTLVGGVATLRTSALPAGALEVTASYPGDGDFTGCAGGGLTQVVSRGGLQVSLVASADPAVVGEPLTLTASVAGVGAPGGTVTFRDGPAVLCKDVPLVAGIARCTPALSAGAHALAADASGDQDHAPASGALSLTVNRAPSGVTLAAAPAAAAFGQPVVLTATVAPAGAGAGPATGTVTFREGDTLLGSGALDVAGVARLTVSPGIGGHAVTASYGGDDRYLTATSSTATFTVGQAATTTGLSAGVAAAEAGQPLTLTATVAVTGPGEASPSGTVTFRDGGTALGTGPVGAGGVATWAVSGLAPGAHVFTAEYGGDAHLAPSASAAVTLTVSTAATSTTLTAAKSPVVYGEPITLTIRVAVPGPGSGAPGGAVTVVESGAVLGTATLDAGAAHLTLSGLEPGTHALAARFPGDDRLAPSASPALSVRVDPAAARVSLVATPSPARHGAEVTVTATVAAVAPGAGVPSGTVSFADGAVALGQATLDAAGQAVLVTRSLAVGAHALSAAYSGSPRHQAATSASVPLEVERAPVSLTVTSSRNPSRRGRPVTFTVTAAAGDGTPPGTVTLRDGDAVLAELPLSAGAASFTTRDLARGTHAITAAYGGADVFGAAAASLDEVVENSPPVAGAGTALVFGAGAAQEARLPAPAAQDPARGTVELWLRAAEVQPSSPATLLRLGPAAAPRLALAVAADRLHVIVTLGAARTGVAASVADGGWHHLAVSSDGQATQVLLDGRQAASIESGLGAGDPGAGALVLGEAFAGAVDELRVWSSARSAAELEDGRYRLQKGDEEGLAALWRFDEASGTEVFDAGPDHLDGGVEVAAGGEAFTGSTAWARRTLPEDHALLLDAGYDLDGDPLTVTMGDPPSLGTLQQDGELRLRYDSPPAGQGSAALAWTLDDGAATAAGAAEVEVVGAIACEAVSQCPSGDLCMIGQCTMPEKIVARSAGGCGAGPAGPGAAWALLGLLVLVLGRARRAPAPAAIRRALRRSGVLVLLLWAGGARAQAPAGFALQTLEPPPPGDRFFSLPDASAEGALRPALALTGCWTDRPLILKQGGHEVRGGHLVDRALWVWGQGSLTILDRVVVDAALPVALAQDGAKPFSDLARVSSTALGDLRLGGRAGLPLALPFQTAVGLDVWLPTGRRGAFASDGSARALPKVLASGEVGHVAFASELGLLVRRDADLGVLTRTGSAFHYAAGVAYRLGDWQVGPEVFGRKQFRGSATSPAEVLLGARWRIDGFELGAAAGTALNDAPGAAPLRVVARIGWRPEGERGR